MCSSMLFSLVVGFPYSSKVHPVLTLPVYTQSLSAVLLLTTLTSTLSPCLLPCSDRGQRLSSGFWISQLQSYMPVNFCSLSITQTRALGGSGTDRKNHTSIVIMRNLEKSSFSIAKHGDEVGLRMRRQIFLLCKIAKSKNISMLSSNEILSRRNNRK